MLFFTTSSRVHLKFTTYSSSTCGQSQTRVSVFTSSRSPNKHCVTRPWGNSPCFHDYGWQLNLILWVQPPLESQRQLHNEISHRENLTAPPACIFFIIYSQCLSRFPSTFLFCLHLYNPLLFEALSCCHAPCHCPFLWRSPSSQRVVHCGQVLAPSHQSVPIHFYNKC